MAGTFIVYSSCQRPGWCAPIIEEHGRFDDAKGAYNLMKKLAEWLMSNAKVKWHMPTPQRLEFMTPGGAMVCYYYAEYKGERK